MESINKYGIINEVNLKSCPRVLVHREHDQSKRGASMSNIISGIYIIRNILNDHKYIGSSKNFQKRKNIHLSDLKANKHHSQYLQRAWNKYGEQNFIFTIIEKCKPEYLIKREQFYIDTINPEYNISRTAGSCLGCKHSEETKQKLSKIVTGIKRPPRSEEHRRRLSEGNKGKPFTQERCRNISNATKGRKKLNPRSEEYRRNIAKAHLGKPLSEEHKKSISESNKGKVLTEEHRKNIGNAISGEKNHFFGKHHSIETRIKISETLRNKKNNKPGVSGVYLRGDSKSERWRVSIRVNNKNLNLGTFKTYEEAVKARKEAEIKYWNKGGDNYGN